MQPVVFRAKVDAWVAVALLGAVIGSLAAVAAVARAHGPAALAAAPLIEGLTRSGHSTLSFRPPAL